MIEALRESIKNLRANKLRSLLTMFGILWGIVSIVVLSATGEGFRRGNDAVLREFGKNIVIIRRGRTSMQAGGERAGRLVTLTLDDARALAAQSRLLKVVSPEIMRYDIRVKSRYNAGAIDVHGVEPQYQLIRTIDLDYGRHFSWQDEEQRHKVAILGADVAEQLFGERGAVGETITIGGVPYEVIGKMRKKDQDSNYSGPDNTKIFVPFASMQQDLPAVGFGYRPDSVSAIIVTPKDDVVTEVVRNFPVGTEPMFARDGIIELEIRGILARRHGFEPGDKDAVNIWNTTLQTAMFDRIIVGMKDFFAAVGFITLALGGLGVMNIMLIVVKDRTVEIGVRKALGARARHPSSVLPRRLFPDLDQRRTGHGAGVRAVLASQPSSAPRPVFRDDRDLGDGADLADDAGADWRGDLDLPGAPRCRPAAGRGAAVRTVIRTGG